MTLTSNYMGVGILYLYIALLRSDWQYEMCGFFEKYIFINESDPIMRNCIKDCKNNFVGEKLNHQ